MTAEEFEKVWMTFKENHPGMAYKTPEQDTVAFSNYFKALKYVSAPAMDEAVNYIYSHLKFREAERFLPPSIGLIKDVVNLLAVKAKRDAEIHEHQRKIDAQTDSGLDLVEYYGNLMIVFGEIPVKRMILKYRPEEADGLLWALGLDARVEHDSGELLKRIPT